MQQQSGINTKTNLNNFTKNNSYNTITATTNHHLATTNNSNNTARTTTKRNSKVVGLGMSAAKTRLLVDTPSPSPPRFGKRFGGSTAMSGASSRRFGQSTTTMPYEAKKALLTPTGSGGFNLLRPIETCIDRLSPTPSRFKFYTSGSGVGSTGLFGTGQSLGGSGSNIGATATGGPTKLTSALRRGGVASSSLAAAADRSSHVTFSMADDHQSASPSSYHSSAAATIANRRPLLPPQRSLTSPAELRLLAVHDGRSMMAYSRSHSMEDDTTSAGLYSSRRKNEYLLL